MVTAMVMGITMDYKAVGSLVFIIGAFMANTSKASGLKVTPSLDLTHVYSDNLNVRDDSQESDQITELKANVHLRNQGAIVESNLNYQYTQLEYVNNTALNKGFSNYDGQLLFKLLDNRLYTLIGGSKKRQQTSLDSPSTLYSTGSQSEVIRYDINNQLNSRFIDFFDYNLNWQLNTSRAELADTSGDTRLTDSDNQRFRLALQSGDFFNSSFWSVNANKSIIEYDRLNDANLAKQTLVDLSAEFGHEITEDTSLFAQYYEEDYEVSNIQSPSLTSSSYGVGLRWKPSSRSYFRLAYNWSLDDLNSNYVSAKLNWQPSQRTSLVLSSSKRFFGDAYGASFSHRHRRISTNVVYTEDITNFQISSLTPTTLGHFICPNTLDINIEQCEFAAGATPTIGSGQQLIPVNGLSPELNNKTYLNKQFSTNISYQFRKTNLLLSYSKNRRTEIDTDIRSDRDSFVINTSYRLNRLNRFNLLIKFDDFATITQINSSLNYKEKQYGLSYSYDFTKKTFATLSLLHRKRDDDNPSHDFSEDRISLTLHKEF